MSTSISWPPIGGTSYSIPASGELNWPALSNFLIALAGAQSTSNTKLAIRVATTSPVTVASATDTVVVTDLSVAGAVAVNLPAGVTGQCFFVADGKGDANTNNITITPAAGTINGAATYVINKARAGVLLGYNGTSWTVLSEFSNIAGGTIPRSSIAPGTANQVVINDGSGNLSSEAALAKSRGGTGADNSSVTFPSTGTITTDAGTATLTGKTIDGDDNTVQDLPVSSLKTVLANANKALVFDASGVPSAGSVNLATAATGVLPTANGGTGQNSTATYPASGSVATTSNNLGDFSTTTSAQLAGVLSDETGTGSVVFGTSPSISTPDIDGGTASNTSRMTLPKASTATLSGLNRKQGTLAFDTTLGLPVFDTGSAFSALATASTATPTSQGNTTSYFPVIQSGISVVTNADATATTSDGFLSYLFSTGNTNRTLTLPAASSNAGRLIYVKKTDTGTGSVTVTRTGSDTIDSATTFVLSKRFEFVAILCDSTGTTWDVVGTNKAPTIQTFTSGSGTYTSPANAVWIKVFCTGGGGGGGGDTTNGSAGSDSTFSTLTGSGGAGGIINSGGGGGGASGGDLNIPGGGGMFGTTTASPGGTGGATFWGAGGRGCSSNATGSTPDAGTAYGAGGGGGGNVNNLRGGGGGGGTAIKTMAAGSYSYSVGSSGSGGSTGGAGPNGAAGASGIIYVEEHYV